MNEDPRASWSLTTHDAEIRATRISGDRWQLTTRSLRGQTVPRASCETTFPRELIEQLLSTTGGVWICEAVARHEDSEYVEAIIRRQLLAYFPIAAFRGRRLLDFGCGNGASTSILARLLPETEVVGVELDPTHVAEARAILAYRRLPNVQVLQSPSPDSLPPAVGQFDFVMLSAVFEHLLPAERRELMPIIWSHLRVGGAMFINQTPHLWQPYEHHSTELWGVNYLPDRVARWIAFRYGRGTRGRTWVEMLRGGIRGGTERAIRAALTRGDPAGAEVLQPSQMGVRDRADYWLQSTSTRYRPLKQAITAAFRVTDVLFSTVPSLNVDVVLRKVR